MTFPVSNINKNFSNFTFNTQNTNPITPKTQPQQPEIVAKDTVEISPELKNAETQIVNAKPIEAEPQETESNETPKAEKAESKPQEKKSLQDSFFDTINAKTSLYKDINDTVSVPRCIFKGYLSFFCATALGTMASIISKPKAISNTLKVASSVLGMIGTLEFVKPLIIKPIAKKEENNKTN